MTTRTTNQIVIAAFAASVLAGCAISDDSASRILVAPGQYVLYNCLQLTDAIRAVAARQRELEGLMAKANVDAAGRFVSGMAYSPEYAQLRGQMVELRKEAASKHCRPAPDVDLPGSRASDTIVR